MATWTGSPISPERRTDPRVLWPDVRSVIMLGVNYGPDENPLAILEQRSRGAISVYAQGDDYHDLIKKRLKALARWLVATSGAEVKVFVDTAAVMEKPLAQAAGLGWQGKHTNLVSREFGSWLFLGAIFTAPNLPRDSADADHCGSCQACLDICPTAAFPAPYQLDARRCISYLTIEHKGPIPQRIPQRHRQPHLWLRRLPRGLPVEQVRASRPRNATRRARAACARPISPRWHGSTMRHFARCLPNRRSSASAATRFIRNVLIAIGNSGDRTLAGEADTFARR